MEMSFRLKPHYQFLPLKHIGMGDLGIIRIHQGLFFSDIKSLFNLVQNSFLAHHSALLGFFLKNGAKRV